MRWSARMLGASVLLFAACGGDGDTSVDGDAAPRDLGSILPLGGDDGGVGGTGTPGGLPSPGGSTGGSGGSAGTGGTGGSGGSGGSGGDGPPPGPVADCAQACERYAACDRLDRVGGDVEACLSRCDAVEAADRDSWFECVERSACGALGGCIVPRPPAPGCAELCGRLEACGAGLEACASLCADPAREAAFSACGRELAGDCSAEALAAFWACAAPAVAPACEARCEAQAPCAGGSAGACLRACIEEVASGDALTQTRLDVEVACYAGAVARGCDAVVACAEHAGAAPLPDEATFCDQWSACGWDFEYPCGDLWLELQVPGGEPYIACLWSALAACGDIYTAFDVCSNPPPLADNRCGLLCAGLEVCDLAAGDWPGRNCGATCATPTDDPNVRARLEAVLGCTTESTCDALGTCLDAAGPEAVCERYCDARANCDAPSPPGCAAECLATFGLRTSQAMRACVADAGDDCAAVTACTPPAVPDCATYCQRFEACGYLVDETCEPSCENAAIDTPEFAMPVIDCVIASPSCEDWSGAGPSVVLCYDEPWRGLPCSALCRQGDACEAGRPGGDVPCLEACGAGADPTAALRLEQGAACLEALPTLYPSCEQIEQCLPPLPEVDCAALCADAARCGVELPDCEAACADDPLAGIVTTRALLCLAGSEQCADVERCFSRSTEAVVRPTFDQFCAAWNRCGYEIDYGPCDWGFFDLGGDGAPSVGCLYTAMEAGCGDVYVLFDRCVGAAVSDRRCTFACEAAVACGEADDGGACLAECAAPQTAEEEARRAPVLACGAQWSCDAYETCVETQSPAGQCARFCAARNACGEVEAAVCEAECDASFARARSTRWRACVAEAGDDCAAVAACTPPPLPPCDRACARVVACGLEFDAEACAVDCEDAAALDPVTTTLTTGCVLAAPACDGPDSVETCRRDPENAAPACRAWCRLVDDCDPAAVRSLEACALACATGFEAEEALRFAAARPCLEAAGGDATCRALNACRPGPAEPDCEAACAEVDGCGIPSPNCAAECGAAPVEIAGCIAEARRLRNGCGGIAACIGYAPEPAPVHCRDLCGRASVCDPTRDAFLCERACEAEPDAGRVRGACLEAAGCRGLEECLALDGDVAPVCGPPCAVAVACGAYPDEPSCNGTCTGYIRSRAVAADYIPRVSACLADAGAPDACGAAEALACFAPTGGNCASYCDVNVQCGLYLPDEFEVCLGDCETGLEFDPVYTEQLIDCADENLVPACNFDAFFNCANAF